MQILTLWLIPANGVTNSKALQRQEIALNPT
jgi:hypothetical protein